MNRRRFLGALLGIAVLPKKAILEAAKNLSNPVTSVKIRKLRTIWTVDPAENLISYHGTEVEKILGNLLRKTVEDLDKEILEIGCD